MQIAIKYEALFISIYFIALKPFQPSLLKSGILFKLASVIVRLIFKNKKLEVQTHSVHVKKSHDPFFPIRIDVP